MPVKPCRTVIIEESHFRKIYLEQKLTTSEIMAAYPAMSKHALNTSMSYYKQFYQEEMQAIRSGHHRNSMLGNKRGEGRKKHVPLSVLQDLLSRGYTLQRMADTLQLAPQTVSQRLVEYGLVRNQTVRQNLHLRKEVEKLQQLEQYAPGIVEAAMNSALNPEAFYEKLYLAFCEVQKLTWFVQGISGKPYSRLSEKERGNARHIAWTTNKAEITLSLALLQEGIPHERQYTYRKDGNSRWVADFFLPQWNLLVEVDGSMHKLAHVKQADREKDEYMKKNNLKFLRLSSKTVMKDTASAIRSIREAGSNP